MNLKTEKLFKTQVAMEFSAAHHIQGYDGDCARPHGHNFKVEVHVLSPVLNSIGIAVDFKTIKKYLKQVVDKLDHQDLNALDFFRNINPTAETIAQVIFNELEDNFKRESLQLSKVVVWESTNSAASYGHESLL